MRPGTAIVTALIDDGSASGVAPARAAARRAPRRSEPARLPIAIVVMSSPNPTSSRPIGPGSTAYRTKIANAADAARFMTPTMIASVRSSRWSHEVARGPRGCPRACSFRVARGAGRNEPAEEDQRDAASAERERRPGERERDRDARQQPAQRRPDELVHRQLDRVQAAVRLGQVVALDDRWASRTGPPCRTASRRRRGRTRRRTASRGCRRPASDRDRQHGGDDGPQHADGDHRPAPVEAVREGARDQHEDEPRQPRRRPRRRRSAPASR